MQIHIVQCAKYRLFQEGYSKAYHRCTLTHTMDSVFIHLEQLTINLWRTLTEFGASLVKDYRKRHTFFSIHLCIFFYWLPYVLMAISQYANFAILVFCCSYKTSSMVSQL